MDQLIFWLQKQSVSCRSIFSLSGFPDLEPRFVVFRNTLNNKTLQQPKISFPTLDFSGDYCPENHCVTLSMCACTFSRSELVTVCYVFCFEINLNFSINNLIK